MATKIQKKVAVKKVTTKNTPKPAVAAAPKVVARKVAPVVTAPKKRATKPVVRKQKPAHKKVTRAIAATPAVVATSTLYPAPHYTRWTLATLGEFYLIAILFSLFVLGILYWCTAMSQFWSIV